MPIITLPDGNNLTFPAGPLRELKTRKSDFYLINSQSNFNNSSTRLSISFLFCFLVFKPMRCCL